jgi:class 3 adenylate cyclase
MVSIGCVVRVGKRDRRYLPAAGTRNPAMAGALGGGHTDRVDLNAAEAAGIRDAGRRRELLQYLDSQGFGLDEMVEAELQGRLFALAGDAATRSGRPVHSLASAAAELGVPLADVAHAWSVLGLTVTDVAQVALSEADLAGLRTWADMSKLIGPEVALGLMRVLGASMARLAEAESWARRGPAPDLDLDFTTDELRTAQAYAGLAQVVPRIGELMDAVHRQHLQSARSYFEAIGHDISATVVCGVGFADLSGFTSLTQRLTLGELSELLSAFGSTASDVVHENGGRVVKLLGDAVMWVNADPRMLAEVAAHLVRHPLAEKAGIEVRAGLGYGPILALDGDYFGPAVNLAARLVAAAEPGQVLAPAAVCDHLTGWRADPLEAVTLRGFDDPLIPYDLRREEGVRPVRADDADR